MLDAAKRQRISPMGLSELVLTCSRTGVPLSFRKHSTASNIRDIHQGDLTNRSTHSSITAPRRPPHCRNLLSDASRTLRGVEYNSYGHSSSQSSPLVRTAQAEARMVLEHAPVSLLLRLLYDYLSNCGSLQISCCIANCQNGGQARIEFNDVVEDSVSVVPWLFCEIFNLIMYDVRDSNPLPIRRASHPARSA